MKKSKMSNWRLDAGYFYGVGLMLLSIPLNALPEFGEAVDVQGECVKCHGTLAKDQSVSNQWSGRLDGYWVTGRFDISASMELDLGTQLDGQTLGALDVYQVAPGSQVIPKIVATDRSGKSAFVIRGMERGGVNVSQSNQFVFSYPSEGEDDPPPPWFPQQVFANPSWSFYYTWDDWAGNVGLDGDEIEFPMIIDASTPEDVYLLTVGLAITHTTDLAFEEHSFYIQVGDGGLAVAWDDYPVVNASGQKWVDTGAWMGWLEVSRADSGWVYSSSLSSWIYMREDQVTENGAWGYILNSSGGGGSSGDGSWATYLIVNTGDQKWVDTGAWMGWLEVSQADSDWVYSTSFSSWIYMKENQVAISGAWGYVLK